MTINIYIGENAHWDIYLQIITQKFFSIFLFNFFILDVQGVPKKERHFKHTYKI